MVDSTAIRFYLMPATGTFWRWEDTGQVVCWNDGTTIAFHSELLGAMQRLAPQGLPPLDALLLLFAATRSSWSERTADNSWLWSAFEQSVALKTARRQQQTMLGEVL